MTEREKTEQDGKRSIESWDENKIEFGEKCNFLMTSVLFLTNLKPSCTPGLAAGLVHSVEEREERENRRKWRAGKGEKDKEKTTPQICGRTEVKLAKELGKPWVGWGALAAVVGWASQSLQEKGPSADTSIPLYPQYLPFPLITPLPPPPPRQGLLTCCLLPAVASSATCFSFLFSLLMHEAVKGRKRLRNSFPCWDYQATLCWVVCLVYFAAFIHYSSQTGEHQHCKAGHWVSTIAAYQVPKNKDVLKDSPGPLAAS